MTITFSEIQSKINYKRWFIPKFNNWAHSEKYLQKIKRSEALIKVCKECNIDLKDLTYL